MTEIEFLHEMVKAAGGNPDMLKDKLKSTYYECLINCMKNGGGGSGGGNSGGVSSWNDLTDRPFGYKIADIVPETTLELIAVEGGAIAFLPMIDGANIAAGKEYTVYYNGTKYMCTSEMDGCVGNMAIVEGTGDSGEPFVTLYDSGMNAYVIFDLTGREGGSAITVRIQGEMLETLPVEYLPSHIPSLADKETFLVSTIYQKANLETKYTEYAKILEEAVRLGKIELRATTQMPYMEIFNTNVPGTYVPSAGDGSQFVFIATLYKFYIDEDRVYANYYFYAPFDAFSFVYFEFKRGLQDETFIVSHVVRQHAQYTATT